MNKIKLLQESNSITTLQKEKMMIIKGDRLEITRRRKDREGGNNMACWPRI